jgi:ribose transport system ATP-binding protein/rhamnose transport system ATP-binding protein
MVARLELRDVSKTFPGVKALERVSLDVQRGEVHALLGENGAGKSTLGKIIAGVYQRDEGSVALDGAPLDDIDEAEAGRLGIGIVHQEGSLVRTLSIADNIFAGRQPTRSFGRIDVPVMVARSRALLAQLGWILILAPRSRPCRPRRLRSLKSPRRCRRTSAS